MHHSHIIELRQFARELGLHVLDYFGCLFRKNLKIPFFRFHTAYHLSDSSCLSCTNVHVCQETAKRACSSEILHAAREIGIEAEQVMSKGQVNYLVTQATAVRADEVYISESTNSEVIISSISRQNKPHISPFPETVLQRWETYGLIDVPCLKIWGKLIEQLLD